MNGPTTDLHLFLEADTTSFQESLLCFFQNRDRLEFEIGQWEEVQARDPNKGQGGK